MNLLATLCLQSNFIKKHTLEISINIPLVNLYAIDLRFFRIKDRSLVRFLGPGKNRTVQNLYQLSST